ncbi:hypothetical protein [Novipirellula artificiosorum]|uniref:IncA protein n=1 Tax=Novipirellula artificiosorum TaxID=2528016 RepID=A0A5C6E092_9BACT|nr:hypothetical protein [Novipirellula artificiosorum]TWU42292.1 hypothetical protein Poly41_05880 [Novipirellula artificiosorum]
MSGRRRQALSPTLFPFLAVLVCTLGTLILFLALVAQKATKAAEQQVAESEKEVQANTLVQTETPENGEPVLSVKTAKSLIAEEQVRLEQVVAFRDEQAADLERKRDELTHLEDHLKRVRDELMRLSDEVKLATGEEQAEAIDTATIEFLKAQLQAEEQVVAELKAKEESNTPRVVIVPHKGPNGTDRRPVYLECTKDGVMIWPEGARVTPEQLANSSRGANPIDAALRVIRHHAMQNYGDSIPPYPLLVVRPDGIESYATARAAMDDWDDQFGYELVPGAVQLAFNPPDPALKRRIDLAIQESISNQQSREQQVRRLARGGGRGQSGPLPTLSAKQLDREGKANGFKSANGKIPDTSMYGPSTNPYATKDSSWSAGSETAPDSANTTSTTAIGARQMQSIEDEMRSASAEMHASGLGGDSQSAAEIGLGTQATSGSVPNGSSSGMAAGGQLERFLDKHYGDLERAQVAHSLSGPGEAGPPGDSSMSLDAPASDGAASLSDTGSRAGDGDPSDPNRTMAPPQFATPDTSAPFSKPDSGQGYGPSGSMAASSAAAASSSTVASEQAGAGGSDSPPPSENRPMGGSMSVRNDNTKPSETRPQNWAIPKHVAQARGNSIIRTIRVLCYEDQFVLLAPSTGGATEMFGFSDESISQATTELGDAVRKRVNGWGPSLPGGRWQPVLDVEIMPGGDARFKQLQQMMRGSGVELRGDKVESLGTGQQATPRGLTP